MRPLLKTLVDLYDAVALAGREMQRVQETVTAALRPLDEANRPPSKRDASRIGPFPPLSAVLLGALAGRGAEDAGASFAAWKAEWTARRRREREARQERLRAAREKP